MGKYISPKLSEKTVKIKKKSSKLIAYKFPSKLNFKKSDSQNINNKKNDLSSISKGGAASFHPEIQDLRVETVKSSNLNSNLSLKLVRAEEDLFALDDLKASYEQYTKYNLIYTIFDEIALEGLDGITLEALWKRIEIALKFQKLYANFKQAIWKIMQLNERLEFFELPSPREELVIHNEEYYIKTYKWEAETYKKNEALLRTPGEWGLCPTLDTRVNITKQMRTVKLDEALNLGNKLVIVASESLRKNAIFNNLMDPNYEFTLVEYCVLEKIGKARHVGEISLGNARLASELGLDPKTLHHYCKKLNKECLVARQFFCLHLNTEQARTGRVIHLRRFYEKRKSRYLAMMEKIIEHLKSCPDFMDTFATVKGMFDNNVWNKFSKHIEFLKYLNININIPYKEFYKGATPKEYMRKNKINEKTVQMIKLKDPFVNIAASWEDAQNDRDSSDEEEEDGNNVNTGRRIFNKDFIRDVYHFILSKRLYGVKAATLVETFDIDYPAIRTVLKKLISRKAILIKKCGMGKQTVNMYVASCLSENSIQEQKVIKRDSTSVLEQLKQRQKRKMDSLNEDRIYTLEQFEVDREHQLLSLDVHPLPAVIFDIPQIICDYLKIQNESYDMKMTTDYEQKLTVQTMKLKLTYPEILQLITIRKIEKALVDKPPTFELRCLNIRTKRFKSNHLTKAFLLKLLLDDAKIDTKELMEMLNPEVTRQAEKRKLDKEFMNIELMNIKKRDFPMYMGSNPVMVFPNKQENKDFVTEIYVSTSMDKKYKKGDISEYKRTSMGEMSERSRSRILIILKHIQQKRIIDEVHQFLKFIIEEESKEGYLNKIDRKTLHRLFRSLTNEGYVKIFSIYLTRNNVTKSKTYVCHPEITVDHPLLQSHLRQFKEKAFYYIQKPVENIVKEPSVKKAKVAKKKSHFAEEDVLRSISEIKQLTPPQNISAKSNYKMAKRYGHRPKFARLALLHELLFYLVYEQPKNCQPINKTEVMEMFGQYQIKLSMEDLENLPPIYSQEISWKTFIPPMPSHSGWGNGWGLLIDVLMRIPLILITRCFFVRFTSKELQDFLQHPIKRFYLLRDLPQNVRTIIMYKKKYVHDIYNQLVLLSYCGLLQFGPSSLHDKEKSFFYLNRNATLLDTRKKLVYRERDNKPEIRFELKQMEDVLKYWFNMYNICTHTASLSEKDSGKVIMDSNSKPSLIKARTARTQESAKNLDKGDIPGDRLGAAGLDSSLCSYVQRNWLFFAVKNDSSFTEFWDTLKQDKMENAHVRQRQLANPPTNKYYLVKPKHAPKQAQLKQKKKDTKRAIQRKNKSLKLSQTNRLALRKIDGWRYKPHWSNQEDSLLILLKIASAFVTPGIESQRISYSKLQDILHIVEPMSRDKSYGTIANRMRMLKKNVPLLSNIEGIISNLNKLPFIAKYFAPFRNFLLEGITDSKALGKKLIVSDREVNNAFLFLSYYLIKHRTEVEVVLNGRSITTDYFNEENRKYFMEIIMPLTKKQPYYLHPENESDIVKYTLKNTIQSALCHTTDKEWALQTYKIYQQFSEDVLKITLHEMKEQRMIQGKKNQSHPFFAPFRLSVYYIFSQNATFLFHTMQKAYEAFNNLKCDPAKLECAFDKLEEMKYGQMIGVNEVLSFMLNETTIEIKLPLYHLVLNPKIDHSDLFDELAKRFQAKQKNEQKDPDHPQTKDPIVNSNLDEDQNEIEMELCPPGDSTVQEKNLNLEMIQIDEDEPMMAEDLATIDNLKHWISDCIDTDQVRSPSPEIMSVEMKTEEEISVEFNGLEQERSNFAEEQTEGRRFFGLKEIKEEMLKPDVPDQRRLVPHIYELTKLLSENYGTIESDERADYLLRKHFLQQYPALEKISVSNLDSNYLGYILEHRPSIKEVLIKIEKEAFVGNPSDKVFDEILQQGGDIQDVDLAAEMLSFIASKSIYGATGYELKGNFSSKQSTCSLELILKILVENHQILKTGVCSVTFVHYKYRNAWLTNTFKLTPEQIEVFSNCTTGLDSKKLDTQNININKWYKIKPMPWTTVEGILDKDILKMWLSQVFSYCIENPKIYLTSLFDKFCYLKPVDVFYLIELLEEIGSLEIRKLEKSKVDLFSEFCEAKDDKATFLDEFEDMYVELNNVGFTSLGSFFVRL